MEEQNVDRRLPQLLDRQVLPLLGPKSFHLLGERDLLMTRSCNRSTSRPATPRTLYAEYFLVALCLCGARPHELSPAATLLQTGGAPLLDAVPLRGEGDRGGEEMLVHHREARRTVQGTTGCSSAYCQVLPVLQRYIFSTLLSFSQLDRMVTANSTGW